MHMKRTILMGRMGEHQLGITKEELFQGGTSVVVSHCYMLCPCIYGLQKYSHLKSSQLGFLCQKICKHRCYFWPRGYKTCFKLNLTENEVFPAHKC